MSPLNEISVPHIKIVAQIDKREEIYGYRCLIQPTQILPTHVNTMWNAQFLTRDKKKKRQQTKKNTKNFPNSSPKATRK